MAIEATKAVTSAYATDNDEKKGLKATGFYGRNADVPMTSGYSPSPTADGLGGRMDLMQ